MSDRLFVPLKSEYFEAFVDGSKTVEFRKYGPRWNESTCAVGRAVTISKGYGRQFRRDGEVVGFQKKWVDSPEWLECYGEPGWAACIEIALRCCGCGGGVGANSYTCDRCGADFCDECSPDRDDDAAIDLCVGCCV